MLKFDKTTKFCKAIILKKKKDSGCMSKGLKDDLKALSTAKAETTGTAK